MQGGTLSYLLSTSPKNKVPENYLVFFAACIVMAYQALHSKGFVYRWRGRHCSELPAPSVPCVSLPFYSSETLITPAHPSTCCLFSSVTTPSPLSSSRWSWATGLTHIICLLSSQGHEASECSSKAGWLCVPHRFWAGGECQRCGAERQVWHAWLLGTRNGEWGPGASGHRLEAIIMRVAAARPHQFLARLLSSPSLLPPAASAVQATWISARCCTWRWQYLYSVDWWSLGVTLVELISGKKPFKKKFQKYRSTDDKVDH